MLKSFRKSKEDKSLQILEEHFAAGLKQLSQKMHNGAMIEFDKAMAINSKVVYPRLLAELEKQAAIGELESAIAIGMNLIKAKKTDYELMNKLGNYAQKLNDFKQAIALYKKAFKIKKDYKLSFYNLAAAEVAADIFNEDAINAVDQFNNLTDYVLPSYFGDADLEEKMTASASILKAKRTEVNIRQLSSLRDKKVEAGDQVEVGKIDAKLDHLKKAAEEITADDVCYELKQLITKDAENANNHAYNLGLYAIANRKTAIAEDALKGLSSEDFPALELLQSIILEQNGFLEQAIERLVQLLAQNEYNRIYNVNLGLMYRKAKKQFLSIKYLIKTAILLKKSDGIYSMRELIQAADSHLAEGDIEKALEFYLVAVSEKPETEIKNKIGTIYRNLKQIDKAIITFKDVLDKDPNSETANLQLREIHDDYIAKGEELFEENKYKPSTEYFDRALRIMRLPESLRRAARSYRQLNDIRTEKQLLEEAEAIEGAEKEKEQERLRQAFIIKGKKLLSAQQYQKAIEVIESAFEMKVDIKVYQQLALLYKKFKGKDSLAGLEKRWSDMVVKLEREEALAKEKERKRLMKEKEREKQDQSTVQQENQPD